MIQFSKRTYKHKYVLYKTASNKCDARSANRTSQLIRAISLFVNVTECPLNGKMCKSGQIHVYCHSKHMCVVKVGIMTPTSVT